MEALVNQRLMDAAKVLESQVDDEIARMSALDDDDLARIRVDRLKAMKEKQIEQQNMQQVGHGKFEEIAEEKDFFGVTKDSKLVVCHFYRDETFRCRIFDKHLAILAAKHFSTRFVKINAEKCPFLTRRLKIKVLPTLLCVKDGKTCDFVVGFSDLGNRDDFATSALETRLDMAGVLSMPGSNRAKHLAKGRTVSTIRQGGQRTDDSDDDE